MEFHDRIAYGAILMMVTALRRIAGTIPVLLLITVLVFMLFQLVPGDPARMLAGPGVPAEDVETLRRDLGLDGPLVAQYTAWLGRIVRGDFGRSIASRQPILPQITSRYANSLQLAMLGLGVAIVIGVPLGIVASERKGKPVDFAITALTSLGVSIPIFWTGIMLLLMFSLKLGWLPATGKDSWRSFVLPVLTIAFYEIAFITRMTRASMIEIQTEDYIRTARSKGLSGGRVQYRHALRNALIPVATVAAVQLGYLLGGAVLTETVFVWPGLGRYLLDGIVRRDLAVVQGSVLILALSFIALNLFADMLYGLLDPRIRYG